MKTYKLYKGSKNPPLDIPIFLRCEYGDWGIGICFKINKMVYFDFTSIERLFRGADKSMFIEWMACPA